MKERNNETVIQIRVRGGVNLGSFKVVQCPADLCTPGEDNRVLRSSGFFPPISLSISVTRFDG